MIVECNFDSRATKCKNVYFLKSLVANMVNSSAKIIFLEIFGGQHARKDVFPLRKILKVLDFMNCFNELLAFCWWSVMYIPFSISNFGLNPSLILFL